MDSSNYDANVRTYLPRNKYGGGLIAVFVVVGAAIVLAGSIGIYLLSKKNERTSVYDKYINTVDIKLVATEKDYVDEYQRYTNGAYYIEFTYSVSSQHNLYYLKFENRVTYNATQYMYFSYEQGSGYSSGELVVEAGEANHIIKSRFYEPKREYFDKDFMAAYNAESFDDCSIAITGLRFDEAKYYYGNVTVYKYETIEDMKSSYRDREKWNTLK